ncbi:hypothetical protein [Streptomyces sp. NPDC057877]|uniref:hypothetical protein n=1 Tax=Streptomyces sp. NPDC057877 TaxID=3346269 RepID=UPI00367C38B6
MSRTVMREVLDRALLEEQFRTDIESDPDRALRDYDLTGEEREVLLSRDLSRVEALFPGFLHVTIRFALINHDIVALAPSDHARRAEIERLGRQITESPENRFERLKDMLLLFR